MRLLNPTEIRQAIEAEPDRLAGEVLIEEQAKLTLKEVGDEMMKMSTLQEFHALRVRLIQGKLEEK